MTAIVTPERTGKKYREENRDKINTRMKKYREDNKDKISASSKEYYRNNPHKMWAQGTIKNHKKRGFMIEETVDWLTEMAQTISRCSLCDIELQWSCGNKNGRPLSNSPSLDVIDSTNKVIDKNNIQIVCYACNAGKGIDSNKEYIARCQRVVDKAIKRST